MSLSQTFFHVWNMLLYLVYCLVILLVVIVFLISNDPQIEQLRTMTNSVMLILTGLFAFLYALGGFQWHLSELVEIPWKISVIDRLRTRY